MLFFSFPLPTHPKPPYALPYNPSTFRFAASNPLVFLPRLTWVAKAPRTSGFFLIRSLSCGAGRASMPSHIFSVSSLLCREWVGGWVGGLVRVGGLGGEQGAFLVVLVFLYGGWVGGCLPGADVLGEEDEAFPHPGLGGPDLCCFRWGGWVGGWVGG